MTSITKNEYEWEADFKLADEFAHNYFLLLNSYGDFPEANAFIEKDLIEKFPETELYMNSDFMFFENEEEQDDNDLSFIEMIDSNSVYSQIKKLAMAWTNIHVSILPKHLQNDSIKILFYLGRALATTMCTLNEESIVEANIAFIKRTLHFVNNAAGLINKLYHQLPDLQVFLQEMVSQLSKTHDITVDYLMHLRN